MGRRFESNGGYFYGDGQLGKAIPPILNIFNYPYYDATLMHLYDIVSAKEKQATRSGSCFSFAAGEQAVCEADKTGAATDNTKSCAGDKIAP